MHARRNILTCWHAWKCVLVCTDQRKNLIRFFCDRIIRKTYPKETNTRRNKILLQKKKNYGTATRERIHIERDDEWTLQQPPQPPTPAIPKRTTRPIPLPNKSTKTRTVLTSTTQKQLSNKQLRRLEIISISISKQPSVSLAEISIQPKQTRKIITNFLFRKLPNEFRTQFDFTFFVSFFTIFHFLFCVVVWKKCGDFFF